MLLRFVGCVNVELPERMKEPDPAVRRRAQTMITRILVSLLVFFGVGDLCRDCGELMMVAGRFPPGIRAHQFQDPFC